MIRHVVILNFKPETQVADIHAITAGLKALPAKIPEIEAYTVGADLELAQGNAAFGIVADFENEEAFKAYANHPDHVELLQSVIKPHVAQRVALQFSA